MKNKMNLGIYKRENNFKYFEINTSLNLMHFIEA